MRLGNSRRNQEEARATGQAPALGSPALPSQAAIQKTAGYAVFDNMGTNLLVVSTARGADVGKLQL
jgi:hypothetical protein